MNGTPNCVIDRFHVRAVRSSHVRRLNKTDFSGCSWQCVSVTTRRLSAKLHYTHTGYGHVVQHHQRTSSQQFYNLLYNKFATSQCQSPTSRHVKMLGCSKFLFIGAGAVLAQKFWGRGIAPSALSSPNPFSPLSETGKKYELYIGLHLKSIISRVANSLLSWTLRPIETRPEGPRAMVRFLAGGNDPRAHQLGGLGERCKLHFDFGAFWDLRIYVRMVS